MFLKLILAMIMMFIIKSHEEPAQDPSQESIYNIYQYVSKLNLQRCAFIAIGLKFFAIFVEDEIVGLNGSYQHRGYFLGVCHLSDLIEWKLCTPELERQRKYKCGFRLDEKRYQPRVHRRFCDMDVLVHNKDCKCASTIFGDDMHKVVGFPTCYVSSPPDSLCKYNVCGLQACTAYSENTIFSVQCDPECPRPFCEDPEVGVRTASMPETKSTWSEWREVGKREDAGGLRKQRAFCINKKSLNVAVDCFGPGTGCCASSSENSISLYTNCTCSTYMKNGILYVERVVPDVQTDMDAGETTNLYHMNDEPNILSTTEDGFLDLPRPRRWSDLKPDGYEYDEDDNDSNDSDLDEDIVLEEKNENDEPPLSTTEELEKDEIARKLKVEKIHSNDTRAFNDTTLNGSNILLLDIHILIFTLICVYLLFTIK